MQEEQKKIKVGVVCITLNPPYWEFANEMLWGLNTFFLKHPSIRDKYDVKLMLWSDIPENPNEIAEKLALYLASRGEMQTSIINESQVQFLAKGDQKQEIDKIIQCVISIRHRGATIFPTEPIEWPMPTLLRYNLFLQQEEQLQDFDYIFYVDVDMKIVDWIGEEILSAGLTAAQHPMYALRQTYIAPHEPNPNSKAYIKLPGKTIEENGKKRFQPYYYAGGFQGGKTEFFIKAMKVMRKNIDDDLIDSYIARWNDESHWNKYLYDNPPDIVLNPGYIYPDSLIAQYYIKAWGRNFSPKIMTLTKPFSVTKEAGAEVSAHMATM